MRHPWRYRVDEVDMDELACVTEDVYRAGFYPQLVLHSLAGALAGQRVCAHLVQCEAAFEPVVHRHITVLALTERSLIVVHVDDDPQDEGDQPPVISSVETVSLRRITSTSVSRVVANPEPAPGEDLMVTEMTIGISWGQYRRYEIQPIYCPSPHCEGDHGDTVVSMDNIVVRVSADVEGEESIAHVERFLSELSARIND